MTEREQHHNLGAEGVLLYYHFTPLSNRQTEEQQWYIESCSTLNLVGRVRIARDGVNATLGGDYHNLQKHASHVAERYNTTSIDFKLTKSAGRKNQQCATESKFTQLTVDIVKEVVTIGLDDLIEGDGDVTAAPLTARHASPSEFHKLLQNAATNGADGANGGVQNDKNNDIEKKEKKEKKETVLVDCRNIYETRIGTFEAEGVTTLDPGTRVFSDLPAWFESNAHKLAGKRVLMCCTGGVRCERASAYLKTLGKCFQGEDDVVQLKGGIERYLQQYGGSGYFKGKNFVFDERGDVGGDVSILSFKGDIEEGEEEEPANEIRGTCCVCNTPWGDYGARSRCTACRMLVLLCDNCSEKQKKDRGGNEEEEDAGIGTSVDMDTKSIMLCELCQQRSYNDDNKQLPANPSPTRARILCLHGFRQTARNFQGRTSALRNRLKHVAELVFIDAPHTLPDIYGINSTIEEEKNGNRIKVGVEREEEDEAKTIVATAQSPNTESSESHPAAPSSSQWEQKRLRRGWLLTPEQYNNPNFIPQSDEMDHEQYHRQTAGLKESLETIDTVLDSQGPWDGILGFSQGASIAALVAARECRQRPNKEERRFKFVICCSGYPSPLENYQNIEDKADNKETTTISMPSLHVYGTGKHDRQICEPESKTLWEQFDATQRVLLRHNNGHVIPSSRLAAARMADFIAWAKEEGKGKEVEKEKE